MIIILRKETNMNKSKDLTYDEEGFEDDGLAVEGDKEEVSLEHQSRRRGKDRGWTLLESFESIADYKTSHIYNQELSKMNMRKSRSTKYAERETFECKYTRSKTNSAVFSKKPIHISFVTRTGKDGS